MSPTPVRKDQARTTQATVCQCRQASVLLRSDRRGVGEKGNQTCRRPSSFRSVRLYLCLPSARTILRRTVRLRTQLFSRKGARRICSSRPSRPTNVSLRRGTLSSTVTRAIAGLYERCLSPSERALRQYGGRKGRSSNFSRQTSAKASYVTWSLQWLVRSNVTLSLNFTSRYGQPWRSSPRDVPFSLRPSEVRYDPSFRRQ